jgi:RNA binding exosome subunit
MVVDIDIREQLSYFCMVNKLTQEKAANVALREMLERVDQDPELKARMDRAKALKEELASL